MEQQTWYEIEYSAKGENDWFRANGQFDSALSAQEFISNVPKCDYEYRIVRVDLTRTPIEEGGTK